MRRSIRVIALALTSALGSGAAAASYGPTTQATASTPNVAAFYATQDPNVYLGRDGGPNDLHLQFDLPGLSGQGILFFKFVPTGTSTLQVALNDAGTLAWNVTTSPVGSFHEIYPFSALREQGNHLTIGTTGGGEVTISDIVLLYGTTI